MQPTHVDIAEQNVEHTVWPPGQPYSRRLPATSTYDPVSGKLVSYTIDDVDVFDFDTQTLDPTVRRLLARRLRGTSSASP